MMELILRTAKEDARIRVVYMNGSRTNPNVPKDIKVIIRCSPKLNQKLSFVLELHLMKWLVI